MGMYTGVRFKGIVKKEFREGFENSVNKGLWEEHPRQELKDFSKTDRYDEIPVGMDTYWNDSDGTPRDAFNRVFNTETGEWCFQCSLKNYEETIEAFIKLLPVFIESVEWLEVMCEGNYYSWLFKLEDGVIKELEEKKVYDEEMMDGNDKRHMLNSKFL